MIISFEAYRFAVCSVLVILFSCGLRADTYLFVVAVAGLTLWFYPKRPPGPFTGSWQFGAVGQPHHPGNTICLRQDGCKVMGLWGGYPHNLDYIGLWLDSATLVLGEVSGRTFTAMGDEFTVTLSEDGKQIIGTYRNAPFTASKIAENSS